MGILRLLVVGLGQRGQQWLQLGKKCTEMEIVAGADPDPTARNLAQAYLPGPASRLFPTLEVALRDIEADAAIICTPVHNHEADCLACLHAGLAVMVEKPFAMTMAEGKRMVKTAEGAGSPLMVAQNYRYSSLERTIKQALKTGQIGEPGVIQCVSHRYRPGQNTYQAKMRFAQIEMAIHHFDNLRAQLGCNAVVAHARVFNPPWSSYQHGGGLHALFEMETGVEISYTGSFVSQTNTYHERIEGSQGLLVTDGKAVRRYAIMSDRAERVPEAQYHPLDDLPAPFGGMYQLLTDLAAAVRERREPATCGRDNLQTLAMAVACMQSSEQGREVTIEEVVAD